MSGMQGEQKRQDELAAAQTESQYKQADLAMKQAELQQKLIDSKRLKSGELKVLLDNLKEAASVVSA